MIGSIFNKKPLNVSKLKTIDNRDFNVTESLLEELLIIEENYFEINKNHIQSTHLAIKDKNVDILTEGLKDFMQSIIEFFKNLLEKFKSFMKRVFMIIYGYIGSFDSFLNKYKDKIKDMNPNFIIKGFSKYTFKYNVPKIDKIMNIIHSYNSELSEVQNMEKSDIIKEREEFTSESYLNRMRAEVLGISGEIESDEFTKRVKEAFRNGEENEDDIRVNKEYLNTVVNEYPQIKKIFNDISKERDRVISLIESLKNFFEKSASVYYREKNKVMGMHRIDTKSNPSSVNKGDRVESNYDLKKMDVINTFFNFKYIQSKEIGGMCVTTMIEKVNAIKECMSLYRTIVRKSLFSSKEEKQD